MSEEEEFKGCEHEEEIINFCHRCHLFLCEDCSQDHLDHLEEINAWDDAIKAYLVKCKNYRQKAHVLLKKDAGHDTTSLELELKVDAAFQIITDKLEKYKFQLKEEIMHSLGGIGVESDAKHEVDPELVELSRGLDRVVEDIEGTKDQQKLMRSVSKSFMQEVETHFEHVRVHEKESLHVNLQDTLNFILKDRLDYEKFKDILFLDPPFVYEDITHNYNFPAQGEEKEGRTWTKGNSKSWVSLSCNCPLPTYFRVKFRVTKFTKHTFGHFGVTANCFQLHYGSPVGWDALQFAFDDNGYIFTNIEGGKGGMRGKSGNGIIEKDGDIITLIYDKGGALLLDINGVRQTRNIDIQSAVGSPHAIKLFLAASLFYPHSQIQLIEVAKQII